MKTSQLRRNRRNRNQPSVLANGARRRKLLFESLEDRRLLAQIAFVDSTVWDLSTLPAGLTDQADEVVVLDGNSHGIQQIADYLDGRTGIDAINIISHGDVGEISPVGNAVLNAENIGSYSVQLATIGSALTADGDILLWGCAVAGTNGTAFVNEVANATGADVAASIDLTGSPTLGGDWDLEYTTGTIEASNILVGIDPQIVLSHYRGGTITWTSAPGTRDVTFTIQSAWRVSPFHQLQFGDGASQSIGGGTPIATGPNYSVYRYVLTHTYATDGPFTATYSSCCRIGGVSNAGGFFRATSVVDLNGGNDGSPVSGVPVIVPFVQGGVNTFTLPAADPQGDPFTFRLGTAAEAGGSYSTPTAGGHTLSISPAGVMTWNTAGTAVGQLWTVHTVIEETNNASTTDLDFFVEIVDGSLNSPPTAVVDAATTNFTLSVGTLFSVDVIGSDADGDNLTINHLGLPAGSSLSPAVGTTQAQPFTGTFSWTPGLGDTGTSNAVTISYTDPGGLQAFASFTVTVPDNQAPIADANGPYSVPEGGTVQLIGSGSDPDGDPITFEWDLDGNNVFGEALGARGNETLQNPTFSAAGLDGPSPITVSLQTRDNNGAVSPVDTATIDVTNVAPSNLVLTLTDNDIDENDSTNLSGTFVDPGTLDEHTVEIDWGDGSAIQTVNLAAGVLSFSGVSHTFLDDGDSPGNNTPFDLSTISVSVSDDDGGGGGGGNILFVSDSNTDENIPLVLTGEGYTVTSVTGDFSSGNNPTLLGDLSSFSAVYWSATGTGLGSTHTNPAVVTNLSNYVTGGGSVFVTGYDSVSSPLDAALYTFLGATGQVDTPVSDPSGPIVSVANSLTTGVVDIQGVTPTGGWGDKDQLFIGSGATAVGIAPSFDTFGGNGWQWTLRTLGAGEIAYVSNGAHDSSASDPHSSWTNTSAGGAGAYNASLRNFALAAAGSGVVSASIDVTVNNVAPTLSGLSATPILENGTTTLSGTIVDVGTLDTFTVEIDWDNDGTYDDSHSGLSAGEFDYTHQYLDDDPTATPVDNMPINVKVTDDDTGSVTDNTTVEVTNVAPEITSFVTDSAGCGGAAEHGIVTATLEFDDPGTLDVHTVMIDWGDGIVEPLTVTVGDRVFQPTHIYATGGVFDVAISIADDDQPTVLATSSASVVITGVGVVGDTLYVVGTEGEDHVTINQTGKGVFKVHADFLANPDEPRNVDPADYPAGISNIVMILCDGDDHGTISSGIELPALIDGGGGDDHLNGGGGPNLIFGAGGNDHINGGGLNDILIGGEDEDRLVGNAGQDFMYGGDLSVYTPAVGTSLSAHHDALLELLSEWDGEPLGDPAADLIALLLDDGVEDKLTGSSAEDTVFLDPEDIWTDSKSKGKGKGN